MASKPLPMTLTGNAPEDDRYLKLAEALRDPLACPLLAGRRVVVTMSVGAVTFNHLLGRTPVGMSVVDATGAAPSYYRTAWDERTISLVSAAAGSVTFWVH